MQAAGDSQKALRTPTNVLPSSMATPTHRQQTPCSMLGGGRGEEEGRGAFPHKELSRRRLAIYDRVYGQIQFPPVIRLFINSPQVQRLRDLKQLGNSHYVYPSATHTRFEHSLGVSHLAMAFLKQIVSNHEEQPGVGETMLPITSMDDSPSLQTSMWCLGIAGLCHDLGHGPLSHMFEHYVNEVRRRERKELWSHEQASISMLRSIWASKEEELRQFGLGRQDLAFVELLIRGLAPGAPWPEEKVGRDDRFRFMTDIIANKRSGLDVDKIDYVQRDSLSCFGTPALVSLDRLFQGACVMRDAAGETQICYQSKLKETVEEIFQARTRLHRIVYQHRVTCVMDRMTTDAFMMADTHFTITADGKRYRLSECVDVPEAYVQTGDWVVRALLCSNDANIAPAQAVLARMQNRRIYTTVGTTAVIGAWRRINPLHLIHRITCPALLEKLRAWDRDRPGVPVLDSLQTNITKAAADMGRSLDPVGRICFYNPRHGTAAEPYLLPGYAAPEGESRSGLPTGSQQGEPEQTFIVFCRMPLTTDELNALSDVFNEAALDQGARHINDRSLSPGTMRGRSSSRSVSGRTPHRPSLSVSKRPREDNDHREDGLTHSLPTTVQVNGPFAGKPASSNDHVDVEESDLLPSPPQVRLQPDGRRSPRRDCSASDGELHDVVLCVPKVSQLSQLSQRDGASRLSADEPDIRVDPNNGEGRAFQTG